MKVVLRDEQLEVVAEAAGDLVEGQGFRAEIAAELVAGSLYIVDVVLEIGPRSPCRGFWRLKRRAWF